MVDRLVLGSGTHLQRVVEALRDQSGSVRVVTDDESLAGTLRNGGAIVEACDPTDADALDGLTAEMVVVLEETHAETVETTRVARTAFPEAYLLAYVAGDAPTADDTLRAVADRVANPYRQAASYVLDRTGGAGQRLHQLKRVFRRIDRLAVVSHDNPDPDAIASGVALAKLAESAGCEAQVCYHGEITHQENRAFVNVLNLDLRQFGSDEEITEFDGIALVDHARPSVNNQLPPDSHIDIVIDHHPPRAPVDASFVDLRSGVGATSTLLVDYLDLFGVEIDTTVATALLFGIHVDTKGFSREVSSADFEAAAAVLPAADLGVLERIESPSVSPTTLDITARAIQNRRVDGQVLLSCVGDLAERDALAQAADRLLTLDDITATLVYGVKDGTIYASARSYGVDVDIGETVREGFDQIGSAGGHVDMAGAQIPLGILDAVEEQEASLTAIIEDIVEERFLDAIAATTTLRTQSMRDEFDGDRYLVQTDESTFESDAFTRTDDSE